MTGDRRMHRVVKGFAFVESLRDAPVSIGTATSGFVVRAKDVATLTSALRAGVRPAAKVRVAVR